MAMTGDRIAATPCVFRAASPYAHRTASLARFRLGSFHRLPTTAGAGQKDLFERGVARFDDLAPERENRVVELLERSAVDDAPRAAAALHGQRAIEDGRLIEGVHEPH